MLHVYSADEETIAGDVDLELLAKEEKEIEALTAKIEH